MTKNRLTLGQAVKHLKQYRIEIAHRTLRDWTRTKRKESLPCETQFVGEREIVTVDRGDLEEWVDRWLLSLGRKPRFGKGTSYEKTRTQKQRKRRPVP